MLDFKLVSTKNICGMKVKLRLSKSISCRVRKIKLQGRKIKKWYLDPGSKILLCGPGSGLALPTRAKVYRLRKRLSASDSGRLCVKCI